MNITLNGIRRTTTAATVAELLAETNLHRAPVATALNGSFLPAGQRPTTPLAEGDTLEILSPMQGG